MRIWSLHPRYLDGKGLVALWRETLLAKKVLEGKTIGYKNHPQLNRFKSYSKPVDAINFYLKAVFEEAGKRNYKFDNSKFKIIKSEIKLTLNTGQLNYEFNHLLKKLNDRDILIFNKFKDVKKIDCHPLFEVVDGEVEDWEVIYE